MNETPEKKKTLSQKLRATLYIYFSRMKNGKSQEFESFYQNEMARIIEAYQKQIL